MGASDPPACIAVLHVVLGGTVWTHALVGRKYRGSVANDEAPGEEEEYADKEHEGKDGAVSGAVGVYGSCPLARVFDGFRG
jgi:hypothetical protein